MPPSMLGSIYLKPTYIRETRCRPENSPGRLEVLDLPPKLRSWLDVEVEAGTANAEMRDVVESSCSPGAVW